MNHWGELAALAAAIVWTLAGMANERLKTKLSAQSLNFWRQVFGLILVGLAAWLIEKRPFPTLAPAGVYLVVSGVVGFALGDSFLLAAFQRLGARLTLLVFSSAPVMTALLGGFFLSERLSGLTILGMGLALGGIALVIGFGPGRLKADWVGLGCAFLAAAGQAGGVIFSKLGLSDLSALHATEIRILGGLIGMALIVLVQGRFRELGAVLKEKNGRLITVNNVILGTLFGVVLSMIALKYTKAAVAAVLMSLMPILILPIEKLFFKSKIWPPEWAGAILTTLGVALLFI